MMFALFVKIAAWAGFAVSTVYTSFAAIFTDAQWADIQSLLNFVVLVYLAHGQQKVGREAPAAAAEQTRQTIADDLRDGDTDLHTAMSEVITEALARRRRRFDP